MNEASSSLHFSLFVCICIVFLFTFIEFLGRIVAKHSRRSQRMKSQTHSFGTLINWDWSNAFIQSSFISISNTLAATYELMCTLWITFRSVYMNMNIPFCLRTYRKGKSHIFLNINSNICNNNKKNMKWRSFVVYDKNKIIISLFFLSLWGISSILATCIY